MAAQPDVKPKGKRSKGGKLIKKRRAREDLEDSLIDISSEDEEPNDAHNIMEELQATTSDENKLEEMTGHYKSQAIQEEESQLSANEENKLVRAIMRFMLFRQMQKPGIPVKREELVKLTPTTYKSQKIHNLTRVVIQKAQARFPELFGMEMKEVIASRGPGSSDGPKVYVLRSLLSHSLRSLIRIREQEHSQALLMILLPLILLNGGKLSEDELGVHMLKIGVTYQTSHPKLGKLQDQLQLLVQKKYLSETRESGPEGQFKVYTLGSLAVDEVQEENVKTFMDAVFKKTTRAATQRFC